MGATAGLRAAIEPKPVWESAAVAIVAGVGVTAFFSIGLLGVDPLRRASPPAAPDALGAVRTDRGRRDRDRGAARSSTGWSWSPDGADSVLGALGLVALGEGRVVGLLLAAVGGEAGRLVVAVVADRERGD